MDSNNRNINLLGSTMMGFFNRKKKKEEEFKLPEIPHEHCWKDFPWYMETEYNGTERTAYYRIIEPYVCITCGQRKDVCLEQQRWSGISAEAREESYTKIRRRYKKYLKPKAIVEDMINNVLLVKSPSYLNMVEEMRGLPHRNVGTSSEMKQVKETDFKINIPPRDYGKVIRKEEKK